MKKRVWLHIIFWVAYVTNDGAMEYAWLRSYFPDLSILAKAWLSLRTAATLLPPKLILSYFLIFITIDRGITKNKPLPKLILQILPALIVAVLLHRIILHYYTVPILLNNAWKDLALFEPRRLFSSVLDVVYAS